MATVKIQVMVGLDYWETFDGSSSEDGAVLARKVLWRMRETLPESQRMQDFLESGPREIGARVVVTIDNESETFAASGYSHFPQVLAAAIEQARMSDFV